MASRISGSGHWLVSDAKWISSMNWIDREDGTSDCAGLDASQLVVALEAYQEALRRRAIRRPRCIPDRARRRLATGWPNTSTPWK